MKGWNQTVIIPADPADEFAWHKGFFWGNKQGTLWKQNLMEQRQRDIAFFALDDIKGKKILDLGCGAGLYLYTFLLMDAGYVMGIDYAQETIEQAKKYLEKKFDKNKWDVHAASCTNLPQDVSGKFDIVFSGDMFEHISEKEKEQCIDECWRVLKPGGILLVKTPNLNYLLVSLFFKRIKGILTFKNPFNMHLPHTHNQPDNEHHGLTTYNRLRNLVLQGMFHEPDRVYSPLWRKGVPPFISRWFLKSDTFNEHIILRARKPVFYPLYNS